jgi:hypothetical protein
VVASTTTFPSVVPFTSAAYCSLLGCLHDSLTKPYLGSAIRPSALPFHLARSQRVLFATRTGRCTDVLARIKVEIVCDPVAVLIYLRRYVDGAHAKGVLVSKMIMHRERF